MKTKKITALMFISLFVITGIVFSLSGIVVFYQKGVYATTNGYYSGSLISINQSDATALVFNRNDFVNNKSFSLLVHAIKIDLESRQKEYFIGVGPSSQILKYVSNVSYDKANSFTFTYIPEFNFNFKVVNPASPNNLTNNLPTKQSFWDNYSFNNELTWNVKNESSSFIIMKKDGNPGLNINLKISFFIPYLNKIDIELFLLGIGSLFIALILTYPTFKSVKT